MLVFLCTNFIYLQNKVILCMTYYYILGQKKEKETIFILLLKGMFTIKQSAKRIKIVSYIVIIITYIMSNVVHSQRSLAPLKFVVVLVPTTSYSCSSYYVRHNIRQVLYVPIDKGKFYERLLKL